ncbi:MAG: MarR family transcriptional regulator [Acidimicrobiia bacterium]
MTPAAPATEAAPPSPSASPSAPEPPSDTIAGLAARLRLAVARVHRRARQEGITDGDDLTASRLAALATVEKHGPLTLGELAAIEQVQPPSMTRIVGRLEEQGFVTREVDTADRRVARVQIAPAGAEVLAITRTRRTAFLSQRIERLTDDERATLAAALPLLERLLEDD